MFEINGIIWQIILVSENHPVLLQPNWKYAVGCCDREKRIIYISEEVSEPSYLRQVLYHEVVHAAISSYNFILPVNQEEFIAEFISSYGDEIQNIVDNYLDV